MVPVLMLVFVLVPVSTRAAVLGIGNVGVSWTCCCPCCASPGAAAFIVVQIPVIVPARPTCERRAPPMTLCATARRSVVWSPMAGSDDSMLLRCGLLGGFRGLQTPDCRRGHSDLRRSPGLCFDWLLAPDPENATPL